MMLIMLSFLMLLHLSEIIVTELLPCSFDNSCFSMSLLTLLSSGCETVYLNGRLNEGQRHWKTPSSRDLLQLTSVLLMQKLLLPSTPVTGFAHYSIVCPRILSATAGAQLSFSSFFFRLSPTFTISINWYWCTFRTNN